MARKKAPQNKAIPAAPENKKPPKSADWMDGPGTGEEPARNPEEHSPPVADEMAYSQDEGDTVLNSLVEREAQLRRLLKAENNEWVGTVGRLTLRNMADDIRSELRGDQDVDMGEVDD